MSRMIDLTGQRFERLVVKRRNGRVGGYVRWECLCDCGNVHLAGSNHLRDGHVKSCGCFNSDLVARRNFKHGKHGTPEYKTWQGVISRCVQPRHPGYYKYGGRGITVCPEWLVSFEAFLRDMGPKPSPAHSIDRIDNAGNYEPANCRWATTSEQSNNKRNSRRFPFRTESLTVRQIVQRVGGSYELVYRRLRRGWTAEDAVSKPRRVTT